MLTRAQKEEQVADLRDRFGRCTGVFVADYCGLTVTQMSDLRQRLRNDAENETEYRVAKNSVMRHAATGTECESIVEHCVGPTALAIAYDDPVGLAKMLVDFAKDHEVFEIKGGVLDGNALDASGVAKLATLPSLLEARAKIVGLIQAPATKLVRLLSEPGAQLARVVGARRDALEGGEDA